VTPVLLDTNVVSETVKHRPDARVLVWLATLPVWAFSSVSLFELASGIERTHRGKRRAGLEAWLAELLAGSVEIAPFDGEAALHASRIDAAARASGQRIDERDLLILATAKARGATVATRNVSHFRGHGVTVYDPFADEYSR
jgi:hypothetical protein